LQNQAALTAMREDYDVGLAFMIASPSLARVP
jgi:hypothetical protein